MKLRIVLALISLFLSLWTPADRTSTTCAGCWQPASGAPTVEETLGVNIHFVDQKPGEVKMIADAGFRWVRMDFKWDLTEREQGQYDFSPYERLMNALAPYQIRPLFILDYGNPIYTGAPLEPPRTEATRQAFAKWAVAAARHFENRGIIWEIYNEPNHPIFWRSPDVNEYVALALTVGRAFREAGLNEKLIGPATAAIDFPFLESCFIGGVLDFWSGVSVHPYRQTNPESAAADYAALRDMIARYRPASKGTIPIISGEWGYSAAWRGMDEQRQAVMLARQFLTNVANGVPLSIWYDWQDDGPSGNNPEHNFGLVEHKFQKGKALPYKPKLGYLAAKTLISHLKGFRFESRLMVGSDEDYVLVFVRENERRIVVWTTSTQPHSLTIPETSGRFLVTGMTGFELGQFVATETGLGIAVSEEPAYLTKIN